MSSNPSSITRDEVGSQLREHAHGVAYLCRAMVGESLARDAAQESFERIVKNAKSFDAARATFRTWAFAVTRNVCRDMMRRRGLESRTLSPVDDADNEFESPEHAPDELLATKLDVSAVHGALASLPEPMRAALVLFHMHEATYEEIAQSLEVPVGTVMTWLHRGRARLRAQLETV